MIITEIPKNICIDTNIIIWGVKKECTAGQEDMMEKTKFFFDWVQNNKINVYITSITLAELLCNMDETKQNDFTKIITNTFPIISFNANTATIYGKLWLTGKEKKLLEQAKNKQIDTNRQRMKVDYQIVACAIAANCDALFTHDKGLQYFADDKIKVYQITNIPPDLKLFSS